MSSWYTCGMEVMEETNQLQIRCKSVPQHTYHYYLQRCMAGQKIYPREKIYPIFPAKLTLINITPTPKDIIFSIN